jgi:hypothetical protein
MKAFVKGLNGKIELKNDVFFADLTPINQTNLGRNENTPSLARAECRSSIVSYEIITYSATGGT